MNSAEEISTYNDNNSHYCSPVLARKNGNSYSFPEKSPKKDKKWSFGSLFRRKKKESDSSSDDESQSRNFLQKKKKKPDKRKRVNNASGFDHVVVPLPARQNHTNGGKNYEDSLGILSEPIMLRNNFIPASDFTNRFVPLKDNHDCLNRNELNRSNNSLGSPSVSSLGRRKKGYVKARAEARRDTSKGEESSDDDDDSQLSAFRSDDSLSKPRDGSSSRRSRAARTQRYLRRRSKDDELRDHIKITKADTHENSRNLQHALLEDERIEIKKSAIKSPILSAPKSKLCYTNSAPPSRPNFSGLTTIPPSHSSHSRYRTVGFPNGMSNKHLSYYASYNDTGNKFATDFNNQRSLSCESNMHNTSTSPDVVNGVLPLFQPFNKTTNVLVNNAIRKNPPPPPPPRDPRRIITVQSGEARPISYSFENGYKTKVTTDHNMNKQIPDSNQNFLNHNFRSTSEDHISTEPLQRIPVIARPSSATTEMNRLHKMNRNNSESDEKPTGYRYLTDKNPRSRKPICIQAEAAEQPTWSQKTFNFWKRKDDEISRNNNNRKSTAPSPLMFTAQTHVTTNIFLPNSVETLATTNVDSAKRDGSPFRPIASPKVSSPDAEEVKRKSSNLEDALDELEAIYNSLHLGDEDLLDRAEKRETAAAQKRRDAAFESFPDTIAPGTINDSSFGFDPNFDSTRKKRSSKKSQPNIKTDDMAFRKLNRDRYNTTTDAQSAISNMSYLLTSPVFNSPVDEIAQPKVKSDEPDVTFDDVVFRNVMRTNNMLKVVDPQPPFGIPMGPISPASNSDYLHATPEPTEKFAHSSKKIPDVVKDDLAYRSLRKDANKGSALPQSYISEEYFNNDKFEGFRKKRAVRSLSANIGNLMHKNDAKPMISITNDYDSEQNITDVADALEIARQILRDKEEKINATRQAFMSDGELKYRRFDSTSPTDQRTLFMNEMKSISSNNENLYQHKLQVTIPDYDRLDSKPPTPDRRGSKASTKESTPIPSSPPEDSELQKQLRQSTLDDLLTSLAVETRETSDKITEELNLIGSDSKLRQICDYDKDVNWNLKLTNESCESCVQNPKRDLEESSIELKVDDDSTLEHVKLCEKLLQCVATNKELLAANTEELELSEEVAKIDPIPEIVANIVLLPTDRSKLEINPVATEVFSESDHDYVNIQSADETEKDREIEDILLNGSRAQELSASFTERNGTTAEDNADLLAAFEVVDETLRKMNIGGSNKGDCLNIEQTDKGGGNRRRSKRSRSCDVSFFSKTKMSELRDTRAERMARYKEERRKQLTSQFAPLTEPQTTARRRVVPKEVSSSSEEPRTTRASRLRAAASAQETSSSLSTKNDKETISSHLSNGNDAQRSIKLERDKSSKRKSNLNRALNSEEVPQQDSSDDFITRRRRRRFFPPEVFQQPFKGLRSNNENSKSDNLCTASSVSHTAISTIRSPHKKSELSVHMENARKGQIASYSDMGKSSRASPKKSFDNATASSLSADLERHQHLSDSSNNLVNKENRTLSKSGKNKALPLDSAVKRRSTNVSKRMDELTALTKDALARVERLAIKTRDSNKLDGLKKPTVKAKLTPETPLKPEVKEETKPNAFDSPRTQKHSILKKKPDETIVPSIVSNSSSTPPISILKRKVSLDEFNSQSRTPPTNTPPVTFSPNVVDPATSRRRQGILKKRRSLDESQVLRHRSCSPDVAVHGKSDSRSILKNQRRSSLEEILRTQSPESGLHSILKRRLSRPDDDIDPPINSPEPHGILKRRSGSSSAGSNTHSPHVSIATAVILAAAGGAEMILESNDLVRPILKKKSFSDDQGIDASAFEVPKPILKKKSSTDTDDCEEKPRPILKHSKNSVEERDSDVSESSHHSSYRYNYQKTAEDSSECEVKPILKQSALRENSPRPRLSFYSNDFSFNSEFRQRRKSRRSHTVCTDFNVKHALPLMKNEDRDLQKPRPLSVCDMVLNIEKRLSTGAIPKTSNVKRHSERYRTQPVTYHELEASRNSVQKPLRLDLPASSFPLSTSVLCASDSSSQNAHSLLDLTTSFDGDNNLNSFLSSSLPNTTFDSGISGKMSSDSAFQSLGDGLELENENLSSPSPSQDQFAPAKLQMKALAEEAKNLRLRRGEGSNAFKNKFRKSDQSSSSRFSTQPVTLGEVKEATRLGIGHSEDPPGDFKLDRRDPARLSISDRIKLFSKGVSADTAPAPRSRSARFQTQPITVEEVQNARAPPSRKHNMFALDSSKDEHVNVKERKGILKSKLDFSQVNSRVSPKFQESLKSVLKKADEIKRHGRTSGGLRSILKPECADFALDEGISSDDSQSGSEVESSVKSGSDKNVDNTCVLKVTEMSSFKKFYDNGKVSSDDTNQTSDGDSSGGREVRSIMEGGEWSKKRQRDQVSNDGFLCKSKSQGVIRDEEQIKTPGVRRSLTNAAMPQKIAELQAKLQQSGDNNWRKRIPQLNNANEELSLLNVKNIYNEELSEKTSILAARKDELDASARQWRNRVEQSDAVSFSVAGRMQQENGVPTIPINIPAIDKSKRTPKAKTFKGKEGGDASTDSSSLPSSPEKIGSAVVKRSISLPGAGDSQTGSQECVQTSTRKVKVERPDNITFTSFFGNVDSKRTTDIPDVSVDDFDVVASQADCLLVQKRTVRVQRRRKATKNPIKALAARSDIIDEYTEIITGVAEKETRRLNVEKLSKSSNYAIEALAGLASTEDFSSVALKRSSSMNSTFPPFKDVMLLQVKGRRFVQTRLVEPTAASVNEGDNYVLVTPNAIYNYVGAYANVIEQSRAADIANSIQQKSDLGCKCDKIITINSKKIASCATSDIEKFWKLLGVSKDIDVTAAGHPDEDEIYESTILSTNMIYEYNNEELVPLDAFWGTTPKIQMLSPLKTFVFDFGSEMYIWSGKNALLEDKKKALKLARELWNEGYNYTECGVSPLGVSSILGLRQNKHEILKDTERPKWALFAKLTQHRETVLFKEKFLDWPDYSRVIRVKRDDDDKTIDAKFDFRPCNIEEMHNNNYVEPDLVADGIHLGRGISYYDEETNRMLNFTTRSVTCWVILEYSYEQLPEKSVGQFHDGSSYIVRWEYFANTTGRELSGKPSKHVQSGRDLCLYFCWQGSKATINEKGAAALLTIQLDSENARQIRVLQGAEPPVFLSLFKGDMVVHSGKYEKENVSSHRLYICRGEVKSEAFLIEVPCSMRSLRSRSCYTLISCKSGKVTIWNGSKASSQTKNVTQQVAESIIDNQLVEFGFLEDCDEYSVSELDEGTENKEFMQALEGEKRQLYMSLFKSNEIFDYTPRLFHLTSLSGKFEAKEYLCPHRSQYITPYPFLQGDLYSVSQPALFMLDNKYEIWLWQGWWPERENDSVLVDQTGSGAIRWQEERKAAMQTVVSYCQRDSGSKHIPAYLVWAGLEPLAFTNLFPFWRDQDDIAELNMQDGKKAGEIVAVEKELALLTRSTYPLGQLLQRPLPDGVDPTHLENYLSPEDFSELMSMTLQEFQKLPTWKQTSVKKEKGLF